MTYILHITVTGFVVTYILHITVTGFAVIYILYIIYWNRVCSDLHFVHHLLEQGLQ